MLQARPLHDCKWDKYVVGKTSPKRRRQTNRLRKETEWSTLFSRVSAGRSERPSLGVAKNVQQFVPRNTRGCPAVTQTAGNKFVSGRSSLGSLPTVVGYAREFVKEWCTCVKGPYVSADLGNFWVGSYRGLFSLRERGSRHCESVFVLAWQAQFVLCMNRSSWSCAKSVVVNNRHFSH